MRVGMGYDVHRLTEDRDLILGGVKIRKWKSSCKGTRFTFSNKRCKVSSERSLLMHLLRNTLLSADHLDKKFLAPQRIHSTMQI